MLSPAHDPANASGDFLTVHGLHRAVLDLCQPAAGFLFPGFLIVGIGGVQLFAQTVNQFADLFRRLVAGFFNDLFQCQWHGAYHTMFRVWIQPSFYHG